MLVGITGRGFGGARHHSGFKGVMSAITIVNLTGTNAVIGSVVVVPGVVTFNVQPGMEAVATNLVPGWGSGTNYTVAVGQGVWADNPGAWWATPGAIEAFWMGFGLVFTVGMVQVGLRWVKNIIGGGHVED